MAWRAVADHAVGGIDRLVECGAREAGDGEPQDRRDDAVGEIFRQALDGGAGDARCIERGRVASDDVRYRDARGADVSLGERDGDVGHVPMQAALRDQCAGK